jgi:hypothetical protein
MRRYDDALALPGLEGQTVKNELHACGNIVIGEMLAIVLEQILFRLPEPVCPFTPAVEWNGR